MTEPEPETEHATTEVATSPPAAPALETAMQTDAPDAPDTPTEANAPDVAPNAASHDVDAPTNGAQERRKEKADARPGEADRPNAFAPASASAKVEDNDNAPERDHAQEGEAETEAEQGDNKSKDATAVTTSEASANGTSAPLRGGGARSGRRKPTGAGRGRKKSAPAKQTHTNAKPGEYYAARFKSYPPWPAIVCDEELLAFSPLAAKRPQAAPQPGGMWNEAFADGGKRVNERQFPVMFLATNDL